MIEVCHHMILLSELYKKIFSIEYFIAGLVYVQKIVLVCITLYSKSVLLTNLWRINDRLCFDIKLAITGMNMCCYRLSISWKIINLLL